jgi:hypothetical protein
MARASAAINGLIDMDDLTAGLGSLLSGKGKRTAVSQRAGDSGLLHLSP